MKTLRIPFSKGARGLLWLPNEGYHFVTQNLRAEIYRGRNGKIEDLGIICKKMITTEGVNFIRDRFANVNAGDWTMIIPAFAVGSRTGQTEAVGDTMASKVTTPISGFDAVANNLFGASEFPTAFVNPVATTGTKTLTLESNFDFVNSIAPPLGITEHFFCWGANGYSGVHVVYLFDRSVFSAINVTTADKIKFTYTLTFQDGG